MPARLNPIRKSLLKKSLLQGKSIRQSMKDAGYSERTAHGNCDRNEPLVKSCIEEIQDDIKKKITVEKVLKGLEQIREKAYQDKDYSTATRCEELQGKYLAMFTDRREEIVLKADEKDILRPRLAEILAKIQSEN